MNILVLYGPGEVAKRRFLVDQKKSFSAESISTLDGKQTSLSQLKTVLSSGSLFVSKRMVILENAADDLDLSEMQSQDPDLTLIIVAQSPSPTKPILKTAALIKAKLCSFEGEKEVSAFPFLDAVIEKKPEASVELEKLLEEYGEMYVLTMLYYLWRRNILPLPSSTFAQKKILEQKKKYSISDFEQRYFWTLEAEYKIKSGVLPAEIALRQLIQRISAAD